MIEFRELIPGRCQVVIAFVLFCFFFCFLWWPPTLYMQTFVCIITTLRPRQKGCHFTDKIFKCIFLNENVWIQCSWKTFMVHQTFVQWALYILFKFVKSLIRHLGLAIGNVRHVRWFSWTLWIPIKNSLKLIPQDPINNIPVLVQKWLGATKATSHYLNQWWLVYWRMYVSLSLNEPVISLPVFVYCVRNKFTATYEKCFYLFHCRLPDAYKLLISDDNFCQHISCAFIVKLHWDGWQ